MELITEALKIVKFQVGFLYCITLLLLWQRGCLHYYLLFPVGRDHLCAHGMLLEHLCSLGAESAVQAVVTVCGLYKVCSRMAAVSSRIVSFD